MTPVLVTGAQGFIGRNLCLRLEERAGFDLIRVGRGEAPAELAEMAKSARFVIHLAGVNRPADTAGFGENEEATGALCAALEAADNQAPIVFASSTQAELDNAYGASKRAAEEILLDHARRTGAPVRIFRLPNVFGKWARPNYNSAVATFCHNIARGLPITIHDPDAPLRLAYVDDVIDVFIALADVALTGAEYTGMVPVYETTVGVVAQTIRAFADSRGTLITEPVGCGLTRALYATYLSYLPPTEFAYDVPVHGRDDPRGIFVEMLKTSDAGQFSYFIAHPGVTRGDHYHHTKTEKFLVISGVARFGFRHVLTGETHELVTRGGEGRIVETIPGWTHNISNIGEQDLVCMLWANEIFDRERPDTIAMKV